MSSGNNQSLATDGISSESGLKEATGKLIEEFDLDIDVDVEVAESFKRKAGQYVHSERKIRVSRYLLENHSEEVIETVKHELGHAVVMRRYGQNVKPHGREWKSMMDELGVSKPKACHSLQLAEYRYIVRCTNSECSMEIGRYRKSRLVKKPENYVCKKCGSRIRAITI